MIKVKSTDLKLYLIFRILISQIFSCKLGLHKKKVSQQVFLESFSTSISRKFLESRREGGSYPIAYWGEREVRLDCWPI